MFIRQNDKTAFDNSSFVLKEIAGLKKGNNIVILADRDSYSNAYVFADSAKALGINAIIIDVDIYGGEDGYAHTPIMEPLRQAIFHADAAFLTTPQMKTNFGIFIGSQKDCDSALVGESKRYTFEIGGICEWNINKEEVLANRKRALTLFELMKKTDSVHVTTAKGSDFTCKVGKHVDGMYPVCGIIPFYSEVAVVPSLGSVNGVAVCDGASERAYGQRGFPIRPNIPGYREIYMEPMKLYFRDSMLESYTGPDIQVSRLDELLATVEPKPDICDELGIVTTTSVENEMYGWCVDGSHHRKCVHVALGNNRNRKEIIHSTEHIDFDIHDPSIEADGILICKDGIYDDAAIEKALAEK